MNRLDLTSRMHRAGLRLDDAATAAAVAVQVLRRERDELIARMLSPQPAGAGLSLRVVGAIFGLSHEAVRKVSTRLDVKLTHKRPTMHAPE